jgi:ATP-dependent RNA helicase DHX8/PRP22
LLDCSFPKAQFSSSSNSLNLGDAKFVKKNSAQSITMTRRRRGNTFKGRISSSAAPEEQIETIAAEEQQQQQQVLNNKRKREDETQQQQEDATNFTPARRRRRVSQNGKSPKRKIVNEEVYNRLQEERKQLPMYAARDALLEFVKQNQCLIVVGETGSGKTTQLPQYLVESGLRREGTCIAITQPRRVAAISIANRVSQEMGVNLGEEVGYSIRFEDVTDPHKTVIKYVTDGMLLRESQINPSLDQYSIIILDEAHERTLHTDILFGVLKRLLKKRKDLKLIVMSATLEAQSFAEFFDESKIVYVSGRQYPVQLLYCDEPQSDYVDACITAVLQIHLDEQSGNSLESSGDILVFLTGQEEIESVARILEEKSQLLPPEALKLIVCPIFAALPSEKQMEVFERAPPGCRKVILATNIAETSITINGIRYVIDSGFVKAKAYNPANGLEALKTVPISKASARQRMGRAGRETSGKCYRIYTESTYDQLDQFTEPEIVRCNLSTVILQLKSMGVKHVGKFEFMSPPSQAALHKSLQVLYLLGALHKNGSLTELGQRMAGFPLDPMYAVALIRSEEFGCVEEVLSIVSMLSVESIFYSPHSKRDEANKAKMRFAAKSGDHLAYLRTYNEYMTIVQASAKQYKEIIRWCNDNFINARSMKKVCEIRQQLSEYVSRNGIALTSCGKELSMVRKCLCSGFFMHAAVRVPNKRRYITVTDNVELRIHPSSVLQDPLPSCVVFNTMVKTSREYMRDISAIDPSWLTEVTTTIYRDKIVPQAQDMIKGLNVSEEENKKKTQFQVQRSA